MTAPGKPPVDGLWYAALGTPRTNAADVHTIGRWLRVWCVAVFVLVLVGGGTRLTESGLSITEWKPLSGVIPPINEPQWTAEFEQYKRIPQYAELNSGMTLGQFKKIFWWEYSHRLAARVAGLVFALPFFWFAFKKRIPRELLPRLGLIGGLTIAQAALGWYMVASGLTARVNVSQYRLAAHLTLAVVIYLISVWTADSLLARSGGDGAIAANGARAAADASRQRAKSRAQRWLRWLLGLALVTLVSGAFVAGLRAGEIYNEFPLMGRGFVPIDYGIVSPFWLNPFENGAAAQFNHRVLAMVTFVAVIVGWVRLRTSAAPALEMRLNWSLGAAGLQLALGIATLLLAVPVALGVAHQAGALLLLTALTLALREASAG